jgi:hypothetical protein
MEVMHSVMEEEGQWVAMHCMIEDGVRDEVDNRSNRSVEP